MTDDDRPFYLRQLIYTWGEPRIAVNEPRRAYREDLPYPYRLGWTWFPQMVNHSLTVWLDGSFRPAGFTISCHCVDRHLQLEGRYQAGVLDEREIMSMIIMAGWGSYAA